MSVRVTDYSPKVLLEINQKSSLFIRQMMDEIDRIANPITPKERGNLRGDILKRALGSKGVMEWRKVYAAPQERGVIRGTPIRNYTTPGTGPHYAERAVRAGVLRTKMVARKVGLI